MTVLETPESQPAESKPAAPEPEVAAAFERRVSALRVLSALACAVCGVVTIARVGVDLDLVAVIAFFAAVTAIADVDLRERRVPNRIVLPAIGAAVVWQAAFHLGDLVDCLAAGAGAGLFFFLSLVFTRGAVGLGDVKLALLLGLVLGQAIVGAVLVAALASAVAAAAILLKSGAAARKQAMPFAPFLVFGAVLVLAFGSGAPIL